MLGFITSPFDAFNPDKDLEGSVLGSYISSCVCSTCVVMMLSRFPVKPFLPLTLCFLSSFLTTIMLSKDTYDRFTRKSE